MSEAPPLPGDDEALLALAGLGSPPDPAQGLFRDDSWLRRVSGQSAVLFGGGRALLLEIAHPLVAAGVAAHSNYRTDPFGRLRRTLDALSAITFRDRRSALAAARAVERAHGRVRGELPRATARLPAGTPYSGRDPELMLWVWATLADTALLVYERFVAPLDEAARRDYYTDHCAVARLLGVPPALVPPDWPAFRAYFDGMLAGDRLEVTPEARDIGRTVLSPPPALAGAGWLPLVTVGLLPERVRRGFGAPWDEQREAKLAALAASVRELRRGGPLDRVAEPG